MAIPISLLWKVQITLRQKVALAGIFSLAIITISFAIIRVTVISVLTEQPDVSWLYMWSFVEQTVGGFSPAWIPLALHHHHNMLDCYAVPSRLTDDAQ